MAIRYGTPLICDLDEARRLPIENLPADATGRIRLSKRASHPVVSIFIRTPGGVEQFYAARAGDALRLIRSGNANASRFS